MLEIKHLSPSTCQSYKKCSKAVYYQKILGIRNKTGYAATAFGSAMHEALEFLMNQKMAGTKISLEEFYSVFEIKYKHFSQYTTVWKEDSVEHLLEQGKAACECFYKYWYNKYDPEGVEVEFNINRGDGKLPIKTIADLITKDGKILDYKFGRSSKPGDYILNMSTYAMCYLIEYGCLPEEVAYIAAKWRKTRQPSGQYKYFFDGFKTVKLPITMEWIKYAETVYDDVERGIKQGVWITAQDNNGLCKNCSYRLDGYCNVVLLDT